MIHRLEALALLALYAWCAALTWDMARARRALSETPRVATATPEPTPDLTATWSAVDATWEAHAADLERRYGP